MQQPM